MEAVLRKPEAYAREELAPAEAPAIAERTLLRFITCGSVDDGKSTLIGRMLFEAGAVPEDQLAEVTRDSQRFGTTGDEVDLALLVDGLAAEREQGITIDVAYRYFSTPQRAFIVADTPGHEQYTRNMATGASTAELAVILVDARKGLLPQTRRHSFIVSLVGIRHAVVAVNKMDLVDYDEALFRRIEADYRALVRDLGFETITVIPVSARRGDNVVDPSPAMEWYRGPTLLPYLETIEIDAVDAGDGVVMPVQWVNRPDVDFRGYAGSIAAGRVHPGDPVVALPSGRGSTVARIVTADGDLETAVTGQSVTLTLADDIDVSRGDVLVSPDLAPEPRRTTRARLLWTAEERILRPGARFVVLLGTASTDATVVDLHDVLDVEDFSHTSAETMGMNEIGTVTVAFDKPLVAMDFAANQTLGCFILIDRTTNETVAFGFVEPEPAEPADVQSDQVADEKPGPLFKLVETLAGPAGTPQRRERLIAVSWHGPAALIVGAIIGVVAGSLVWGVVAAAADFVARPILRRGHAALVRRVLRAKAQPEVNEHGGGI